LSFASVWLRLRDHDAKQQQQQQQKSHRSCVGTVHVIVIATSMSSGVSVRSFQVVARSRPSKNVAWLDAAQFGAPSTACACAHCDRPTGGGRAVERAPNVNVDDMRRRHAAALQVCFLIWFTNERDGAV